MTRLAKGLAIALLVWSLAAVEALAEGRWQNYENKATCAVWNPNHNQTRR